MLIFEGVCESVNLDFKIVGIVFMMFDYWMNLVCDVVVEI